MPARSARVPHPFVIHPQTGTLAGSGTIRSGAIRARDAWLPVRASPTCRSAVDRGSASAISSRSVEALLLILALTARRYRVQLDAGAAYRAAAR